MPDRLLLVLVLALFWGFVWAGFLQFTDWGRWMAAKRTWITVFLGVGVNGLIVLLVVPFEQWLMLISVMSLSSIGVIIRSLANEFSEDQPDGQ